MFRRHSYSNLKNAKLEEKFAEKIEEKTEKKAEEKKLDRLIEAIEKPEDLTIEVINLLGQQYLENHPKKTRWHCNQILAKQLKDYQLNSTMEANWIFLINIHSKLHSGSTFLMSKIRLMFEKAFQCKIENVFDADGLLVSNERVSRYFLKPALDAYLVSRLNDELKQSKQQIADLKAQAKLKTKQDYSDSKVYWRFNN